MSGISSDVVVPTTFTANDFVDEPETTPQEDKEEQPQLIEEKTEPSTELPRL